MRHSSLTLALTALFAVGATSHLSGQGLAAALGAPAAPPLTAQEERLLAIAKSVHEKVMPIDGHIEALLSSFRIDSTKINFGTRMVRANADLVKMGEGGLDGAFLVVYANQTSALNDSGYTKAHDLALEKFQSVRRLLDSIAPNRVALALNSADAKRIHAAGKKAIFIGVDNGYAIGTNLGNIKKFFDMGARYMSLVHTNPSQLSDSHNGERTGNWMWNGLSPLGRDAIMEMNRVGMVVDISYESKIAMLQTLQISKAPLIASNADVRNLCNSSRNLDDEILRGIKKNGGVVQLTAIRALVRCNPTKDSLRNAALLELRTSLGLTATTPAEIVKQVDALPKEKQAEYVAKRLEITDRRFPPDPRATLEDFIRHIDYVVQLIGVDHVGIASDFDGGGGVDGWANASESFNVTLALVKRGYSDEDIAKLWGGNLLRVIDQAQDVAKQIQVGTIKQ